MVHIHKSLRMSQSTVLSEEGKTTLQSGSWSHWKWQGHYCGSIDRMKPVVGVFGEPCTTLQGAKEENLKWYFYMCVIFASVADNFPSANCWSSDVKTGVVICAMMSWEARHDFPVNHLINYFHLLLCQDDQTTVSEPRSALPHLLFCFHGSFRCGLSKCPWPSPLFASCALSHLSLSSFLPPHAQSLTSSERKMKKKI